MLFSKSVTGGTTALGSSIFGKYFLNGYIKDFSYSSNELSENDIISLYNKTLEDDTGTTITNSYTYEDDRIKTINHNGFSYSFGYDSFGNNQTVAVAGQNLITNSYNPITGNLEEFQYGNGQRISLDYDDLNRVIARNFKDTTDPNLNTRYTYQYDNAGNLGYHEDQVKLDSGGGNHIGILVELIQGRSSSLLQPIEDGVLELVDIG